MNPRIDRAERQQRTPRIDLRPLTPNEHFWLEAIRLSSWDSDPAPTLERVQRLRQIFERAGRGGSR